MRAIEIKRIIEGKLSNPDWVTSYDRESEALRVVHKEIDQGVTIQLSNIKAKLEDEDDKEKVINQVILNIEEGMRLLTATIKIKGNEKNIYPVIRTASFKLETNDGKKLIYSEHTAETKVFYAVDSGPSYSFITEEMLRESDLSMTELKEMALFNVRSLPNEMKKDTVAGNDFYFLSSGDGYEASRIMNDALLDQMESQAKGQLAVSIPHHEVLIFADIRNETGFDVLGQMVFKFFSEGRVPLTALPFIYENKELEPVFILASKKPKD